MPTVNDVEQKQASKECTVPEWTDLQLPQDQAAAIDALVEAGMDRTLAAEMLAAEMLAAEMVTETGAIGEASAELVAAMFESLSLLDAYVPADDPGMFLTAEAAESGNADSMPNDGSVVSSSASTSLVDRTLARIEAAESERVITPERAAAAAAATAGGRQGGFGSRFGLREIGAAAAAIIVLASVSIPMVDYARAEAQRIGCRSNMGQLAAAFDAYAGANNDALPMVRPAERGENWLESRSASANLLTLAKAGFTTPETLSCPANEHAYVNDDLLQMANWPTREAASFSYQHLAGDDLPNWSEPQRMALLSDWSPVVQRIRNNEPVNASDRSPCHGGGGQNVMFNDGSAAWVTESAIGPDHIWLPDTVDICEPQVLTGTEYPAHVWDTMLVY